jgi:hypothetical protein
MAVVVFETGGRKACYPEGDEIRRCVYPSHDTPPFKLSSPLNPDLDYTNKFENSRKSISGLALGLRSLSLG